MEDEHMIKQLDQMNQSVVQILVEQAKTSTSVDQILKEMVKVSAVQVAHEATLTAHEIKITKLESGMKILVWVASILTGLVTTVAGKLLIDLIGGH